jgi:hypothetical protein
MIEQSKTCGEPNVLARADQVGNRNSKACLDYDPGSKIVRSSDSMIASTMQSAASTRKRH